MINTLMQKPFASALVCVLCMLCWTVPALASGVLADHIITFNETMDDNVDYKGRADLVTNISSRLNLSGLIEDTTWRLGGGFSYNSYQDLSDRDRTDRDMSLELSRSFTERVSGALTTSVEVDHVTETSLEEFALVVEPTRRITCALTPSLSYRLDESNSFQAMADLRKGYSRSPDVADPTSMRGSLSWARRINETTSLNAAVSYLTQDMEFETRNVDYDLYYAYLGLAYAWSEDLDLSINAGPSRSETKIDYDNVLIEDTESSQDSYYLGCRADWRLERGSYYFDLTREQSQTTAGRAVTKVKIDTQARYRWTERLNSFLRMQYTFSEQENDRDETTEQESYRLSTGLEYKLTEDMEMRFRYTRGELNRITAGSSDQRNMFSLEITRTFQKLFD